MLALLGLLAVAGYQNRDKIGEVLGSLGGSQGGTGNGSQGGLGGLLGGLEKSLGGTPGSGTPGGLGQVLSGLGAGGAVTGGLGDLMNSFRDAGHGEVADSWVKPGVPTQGLTPQQVAQAVGEDNLNQLTQSTGLSRDELLKRLATAIPQTVDKLTPDGKMPSEAEARQNLGLPA
jgi:uncharacterized protein YidB (DUF937 family)